MGKKEGEEGLLMQLMTTRRGLQPLLISAPPHSAHVHHQQKQCRKCNFKKIVLCDKKAKAKEILDQERCSPHFKILVVGGEIDNSYQMKRPACKVCLLNKLGTNCTQTQLLKSTSRYVESGTSVDTTQMHKYIMHKQTKVFAGSIMSPDNRHVCG